LRKINVTHVISDTNIGGAGRCLLNFLECFDREALDVRVVVPRGALLVPEVEALGVEAVQVDGIGDRSLNVAAVSALARIFRKTAPDIVHTHAALSARFAARLAGAKIVHTRHSAFDQPAHMKAFPRKQLHGLINSWFSDAIISVSPAATANLVETGTDPRRITLVYNGVPSPNKLGEADRFRLRAEAGFAPGDFVAAIIARLSPEKGHDCLLDAAKILAETNIKLAVAGTGEREEHLRQRLKRENIGNVTMLGFVKDVHRLENILDAQVNCSIGAEATSLSLLEGMSLGIPAVVSASGGNPYVVEHGLSGLVVPPGDPHALALALRRLQQDNELYVSLSQGASDAYNNRFTAQRMCDETTNIYRKLVKA